jgi:TRAP-type C4-dicarboxylate transport system permease small subunit
VSLWQKISERLTAFFNVVASVALLVAMATVCINVIGRAFFGVPLLGTVEIVGLSGVFLIPLAMGTTEKRRRHLEVEMLADKFSEKSQNRYFGIWTSLLCLVTVGFITWGGILQFDDALTRPDMVTPVLRLPKAPFIMAWIIGCCFLIVYLAEHFIEILSRSRKK